ncbi:MAG: hypothetical protein ACF8TS_04325 [Maioricimonas sp. JB049]
MSQQVTPKASHTARDVRQASRSGRSDQRLQQIRDLLDRQQVKEALAVASGRGTDSPPFRNARAVCMMRLGDVQQALRILRSLAVTGGITLRTDAPLEYQINFATALAMSGNAQGAVSILDSINREEDPRIRRLREAIAAWQKQLTFWKWIQWKGGMAVEQPVSFDFEPGELLATT